jgi:hypothetical protein
MARKPVPPCIGEGMVTRRVIVRARDVVFFKGVIEASEGLAAVFAERGGDLVVAAPAERSRELDAVMADLHAEDSLVLVTPAAPGGVVAI